jgi:hypothetical protein
VNNDADGRDATEMPGRWSPSRRAAPSISIRRVAGREHLVDGGGNSTSTGYRDCASRLVTQAAGRRIANRLGFTG